MYQSALWLDTVKRRLGDDLRIRWRSFALEQQNSKQGPEWKAWEQGPEYESRGLLALRAGVAAGRQGGDAHTRAHMELLAARHRDRKDLKKREVVLEAARVSGLDVAKFERDLDDPASLAQVAEDHEFAASMGVFGTPTFLFEDGSAAFLKMYAPPEKRALQVFEHIVGLGGNLRFFGELKRPQPPWPRGVFADQ